MTAYQSAEDIVRAALEVAGKQDDALLRALDEIEAPLYVTDPDGLITYFNRACVAFAGRMPTVREDRWCVTWKLYTQVGEFLPHDACPMATALKEKRTVRGLWAVAERPDGTRVAFMPYPTPIISDGRLLGAVNVLIDITDADQAKDLLTQAARARRLARAITGDAAAETLERVAVEYEMKAAMLIGQKPASRPHCGLYPRCSS